MADVADYTHTNYRMAAARIGIAIVLLPLLWGGAVMLYLSSPQNVLLSCLLAGLGLPFIWYAIHVPLSLRIGEVVTVRYLFWKRVFPRSELLPATYTVIRRNFTLSQMLTSRALPAGKLSMAKITTKDGQCILLRSSLQETEELNHRLRAAAGIATDGL